MGLTRSRDKVHHRADGLHLEFSSYLASFPRELSYLITLSGILHFLQPFSLLRGDDPQCYFINIFWHSLVFYYIHQEKWLTYVLLIVSRTEKWRSEKYVHYVEHSSCGVSLGECSVVLSGVSVSVWSHLSPATVRTQLTGVPPPARSLQSHLHCCSLPPPSSLAAHDSEQRYNFLTATASNTSLNWNQSSLEMSDSVATNFIVSGVLTHHLWRAGWDQDQAGE